MLGQCILDGVGVSHRDRATALEWIVTAAELGHLLARKRVSVILKEEYQHLNAGIINADASTSSSSDLDMTMTASTEERQREALKWMNSREQNRRSVNIERRFTIGGGTTNRAVLATRISKVAESRDTTGTNTMSNNKIEEDNPSSKMQ
jgi:hypothetical protein